MRFAYDKISFSIQLKLIETTLNDCSLIFVQTFRLGKDWNDICPQAALKQTNELILSPMNVHNIPPLLANAVIKKPHEPVVNTSTKSSGSNDNGTTLASSDESQTDSGFNSSSNWQQQQSTSQDSYESAESTSQDRSTTSETYPPSMANFLPENSFFYNEKNCYIFPGAEIWWNKDSDDLESTSSDSSCNDDDDDVDDDIEDMELSTIERNEMMSDVETTIAVDNDLLDNTNEHEFNKYLLKRNANTSLENIHLEANEIDELSPKRLKTQQQTESVIDHLHVEHNTSTMCETLDSSCSSSNSSISSNSSGSSSDPSLSQNEVFSPKL